MLLHQPPSTHPKELPQNRNQSACESRAPSKMTEIRTPPLYIYNMWPICINPFLYSHLSIYLFISLWLCLSLRVPCYLIFYLGLCLPESLLLTYWLPLISIWLSNYYFRSIFVANEPIIYIHTLREIVETTAQNSPTNDHLTQWSANQLSLRFLG